MNNQSQNWIQKNLRTIIIVGIIILLLIMNWGEIVSGFNAGYNDAMEYNK